MAKSYRISIIFNNSKFRKITASASKFMLLVVFVFFIECSILIAWTIVAPLKFVRVLDFVDQYDYPVASHGACLGPAPVSGIFVGVLCGLHALQVITTMRVTQRLTRVPARFQETRWINIAALSMGQLYLIGLPSAAAVYGSPLGRFLVLSSVVFMTCLALLAAIFYPKYMMKTYGEEQFKNSTFRSLSKDLSKPTSTTQLKMILDSDPTRRRFRQYLQTLKMDENIRFWDSVTVNKVETNPIKRAISARAIIQTFVLDTSPLQVNLSSKVKDEIVKAYNDNDRTKLVDEDFFQPAMDELFQDLHQSDAFRTFVENGTFSATNVSKSGPSIADLMVKADPL